MINDREDSYFYLQVYYVTSEFLANKGIFMDSIHKVVKSPQNNRGCNSHSVTPLFIGIGWWLGFLKNHRWVDQDFLIKIGGQSIQGGCLQKGKHYFSLIMYGFCSYNTLYSASLSFRVFIFILILLILQIVTSSN